MENQEVHYSFSFPFKGKGIERPMGAFCHVFKSRGWLVEVMNSSPKLVVSFHHHHVETYLVHVEVERIATHELQVSFSTDDDYLTLSELELYAADLKNDVNQALHDLTNAQLENLYKRKLQESEINFLKQKTFTGGAEDESTFHFLYRLFFTGHPMQFLAWIFAINTVVFICMAVAGVGIIDTDVDKAISWGAIWKKPVMEGEYWRLLTACFVHFGIEHLFSNMLGLLLASVYLIVVLNRWQFLVGYLVTGVVGFAVSVWWHTDVITAGASGAIFGCYGMLIGLTLTPLMSKKDRTAIAVFLAFYTGLNLLYSLKDSVDASAHVGGLLAGIPIGIIYYFDITSEGKLWSRILTQVIVIGGGMLACAILIKSSYYYGTDFYRMDKLYTQNEDEGLAYYRTRDTVAEVEIGLLKHDIAFFEKAIVLADSMKQQKQKPKEEQLYADRLYAYTDDRLTAMRLRLRGFEQNSAEWNDSIVLLENRVDSLLKIFHEEDK